MVDVLGPLGHGFPVEEAEAGQTALLVDWCTTTL